MLLACAFGLRALWWPPSCPVRVLLPLSDFHTKYSESVSGSLANPTSPQHSLRLSLRALQPKWRERNHHKALCNDFRSWTPNWPFSNSASTSASVSSLVAFGQFPFPCRTRFFRLAASTSLNVENSLSLRMLIKLLFSCKQRWKLRWKPLKVPGSYSEPFCLRTEMKNLAKRRSSSLAGTFSIALDSFSDSQNFFHSFKSLLVLYWVFSNFCSCKHFWISTSSLFVASSQDSNLPTFARFLYLLPREGQLILSFSIINRDKPIFFIFFVCNFLRTTVTTRSV